jgi:hypothetical protein
MRTAEGANWIDTETSSVIETYSEISRFSDRQKPDARVIWMAGKKKNGLQKLYKCLKRYRQITEYLV